MRKFEFKQRNEGVIQRKFSLETTKILFLDDKRLQKRSDKTIKTYDQMINHFAKYCAEHDLTGAESGCVREYVHYLTFEKVKWDDHPTNVTTTVGVTARTVNNTIRVLRVFYNWSVRKKYIGFNPANEVDFQTEDIETFEVFTDEEVEALLNTPRQRTYTGLRDYVMMVLMIDTGMRVGEMTAIIRSDIDLTYRQIALRAETTKGRKARIIPISRTVSDLLRKLFEYIGIDDEESEELVFLTQFGERYYGDTFAKMLKKYADRAKYPIKARVSPHTFRHYFAVKFLRNGGDTFALMKILGHTDISMTQRYVQYASGEIADSHDMASPAESIISPQKKPRGGVKFR